MPSAATTPDKYLAALPADRREALSAVRTAIAAHLDPKITEGMQYGMIGYFIPHSIFPAGYHCDPRQPLPVAGLAAQKSHMALYLMCVYLNPELDRWFRDAWQATGKKLDMGKGCVRFKKLDELPLAVITELFRRVRASEFIATYQANLNGAAAARKARATAKPAAKAAARPATKPAKATKVAKPKATKPKPAPRPTAKPAPKATPAARRPAR
jgi:hypothetical protein